MTAILKNTVRTREKFRQAVSGAGRTLVLLAVVLLWCRQCAI